MYEYVPVGTTTAAVPVRDRYTTTAVIGCEAKDCTPSTVHPPARDAVRLLNLKNQGKSVYYNSCVSRNNSLQLKTLRNAACTGIPRRLYGTEVFPFAFL